MKADIKTASFHIYPFIFYCFFLFFLTRYLNGFFIPQETQEDATVFLSLKLAVVVVAFFYYYFAVNRDSDMILGVRSSKHAADGFRERFFPHLIATRSASHSMGSKQRLSF